MAGGWLKRRRYAKKLVIDIIPFALDVIAIYAEETYHYFPPIPTLLLTFGLVPFLLIALLYGGRNLGRIIDPLDPVEKAFENLYTALDYNDPEPGEKYGSRTQEHIHKLMKSVSYHLSEAETPDVLTLREVNDLVGKTRDLIYGRLVPASRTGELTPDIMRQLAKFLAKPSINGQRQLNSEIEHSYKEGEKEGIPIGDRISRFYKSRMGQIAQSLIFGFGVSVFASVIYAFLTSQDFFTFAKDNPAVVLGGAFGLTGVYLTYMATGHRIISGGEVWIEDEEEESEDSK